MRSSSVASARAASSASRRIWRRSISASFRSDHGAAVVLVVGVDVDVVVVLELVVVLVLVVDDEVVELVVDVDDDVVELVVDVDESDVDCWSAAGDVIVALSPCTVVRV